MILVVLWCFFIIPTILFAVQWIKKTCEKITLEQGFRGGVRIGLFLGIGGIIILCIFASPVVGTIWFVQTIQEINSMIKEKRKNEERAPDEPDIFDI